MPERGGRTGGARRRATALAVAAALAASGAFASGCGRRATQGTAGDKLNPCAAMSFIEALDEPSPDEHGDVVRYAEDYVGILSNVSERQRYRDARGRVRVPPRAVLDDLRTQRSSMVRFRDAVRAAGEGDGASRDRAVRLAEAQLAADRAYLEADRRLQEFFHGSCG